VTDLTPLEFKPPEQSYIWQRVCGRVGLQPARSRIDS